jgi:hypothetical protein
MAGIGTAAANLGNFVGSDANGYGYWGSNAVKYINGSSTAYGATYTAGDKLGFALDMGAGTLEVFKNGVSQGIMVTGLVGTLYPMLSSNSAGVTAVINCGDTAFTYTPPAGYVGLA